MIKKPELLAPAGSLEKLKIALLYGADAVYCSTPRAALRARTTFTMDELKEGIEIAHSLNKKVYITTNAFPRNATIDNLQKYLPEVIDLNPDGFIVADVGVFRLLTDLKCEIPIHISTQANIVNYKAVDFYKEIGAYRVILAREVTGREISEICEKVKDIEIEMFVHGEMCMAYSGRCFLSNHMTARDSNQGTCAHSCRWQYKLYMEEEQRPGVFMPIEHTEVGDYFLSSKDLCLIKEIPQIMSMGVDSIKIAGRNKTSYYVAMVVRAYRKAIDIVYENEILQNSQNNIQLLSDLYNELLKTRHRDFMSGFFYSPVIDSSGQTQYTSVSNEYWRVKGIVRDYDVDGYAKIEVKNFIDVGEDIEVVDPKWKDYEMNINEMLDDITREPLQRVSAGQGKCVYIKLPVNVPINSFLRARINS